MGKLSIFRWMFIIGAIVVFHFSPTIYAQDLEIRIQKEEEAPESGQGGENIEEEAENPPEEEDTIYQIRQRIEKAQKDRYELLRLLGYIYTTTGKTDEAIEMYKKALAVEPDDREMLELLIKLYKNSEKWSDMISVYEQLLEKYEGENSEYFEKLIDLYLRTDQDKLAVALVE